MGIVKHCLSVYTRQDTGETFAEAWIMLKVFGKRFNFWKRREKSPDEVVNEVFVRREEEMTEIILLLEIRHFRIWDTLAFPVLRYTNSYPSSKQNKRGPNAQYNFRQRSILNEIDAKEYLLRVAEKYHIPEDEIELTKKQLVSYTKEKEMLKERGEWDE